MISLDEQIAAVERELKMRRSVYPRWVLTKKLSQDNADKEMARMEAVLGTLKAVAENGAHSIPDVAAVRRLAQQEVVDLFGPFMHSSKVVALTRQLWGGK